MSSTLPGLIQIFLFTLNIIFCTKYKILLNLNRKNMIRRGIPPPSSHRNGQDTTRSEYSHHTEVNMTRQGGKSPPCCVPCQSSEMTRRDDPLLVMLTWEIDMARRDTALLVTPTWKIDMARRVVALPVTPKWEINVARRDSALLVTPKWRIDVARGAVALLFTS